MRISDWSSDVCSSDLRATGGSRRRRRWKPAWAGRACSRSSCRNAVRGTSDMVTGIRTIVRRLLLLALLASAGVGWSDRASAQARAMPGTDWVPVDPALLDDLRGGFQLPSGLLVSFGIARVAWVNGELVSYLRVDIPDVARMTPAEAEALSRLGPAQPVPIAQGNVLHGAHHGH